MTLEEVILKILPTSPNNDLGIRQMNYTEDLEIYLPHNEECLIFDVDEQRISFANGNWLNLPLVN